MGCLASLLAASAPWPWTCTLPRPKHQIIQPRYRPQLDRTDTACAFRPACAAACVRACVRRRVIHCYQALAASVPRTPLSYVLRLVPMELLALHLSQRSPSTREQRWRLSEPLAQPRRAGLQQAASEMLGGALLRLGLRPRRVRRRALCEPAELLQQHGQFVRDFSPTAQRARRWRCRR